jgi:hypothetical protein
MWMMSYQVERRLLAGKCLHSSAPSPHFFQKKLSICGSPTRATSACISMSPVRAATDTESIGM